MSQSYGTGVSVIIPTYNREDLAPRAIDSALRAVSAGDEIIVVDDGSTDQTEKALAKYAGYIRYVKTANCGAGAARNKGVQLAKHDWIAFLDSDDEWMPDHLDIHRSFMAVSNVLFSFSNFDILHDHRSQQEVEHMQLVSWTGDFRDWGEIIAPGVPYSRFAKLPQGRSDFKVHIGSIYNIMLRASYTPAWTSIVRHDVAEEHLRFPEDLPTFEDYECYIRLSEHGDAAYLDCPTAINHGHNGPRLTGVDDLTKAEVRLVILERTYGKDENFLEKYKAEYDAALERMFYVHARELLHHGLTKSARRDLAKVHHDGFFLKFLSRLPGVGVQILWRFWRSVKKIFR